MTRDKGKLKFYKGGAPGVQLVAIKTDYPADSRLQQAAREFGPNPEQYFDGISPHVEVSPKQHL